jgi:hypothetical protein
MHACELVCLHLCIATYGSSRLHMRAGVYADLVQKAQALNLNGGDAFDWYIDAQGRACVANVLATNFQQGIASYVLPQFYDGNSEECLGEYFWPPFIDSLNGTSPTTRRSKRSLELVLGGDGNYTAQAVPIPGMKDVPCTKELCGF